VGIYITGIDKGILIMNKKKDTNIVSVRWFDGYLEEFECEEVRFGSDIL
jgi:hypothetical protein